MHKDFLPCIIVDATQSDTRKVVSSLTSIIKQTVVPPKIKVIVDPKTELDIPTAKDIVNTKDGAKIEMSFQMLSENEADETTLLRNIKSFKKVYGIHRSTKKMKLFLVTHIVVLRAGHAFMANNIVERLIEDWREGHVYYDCMFFKMRNGSPPSHKSSFVVYLPVVRSICNNFLFDPIIKKQELFMKAFKDVKEGGKNVDYRPVRTCQFGILDAC